MINSHTTNRQDIHIIVIKPIDFNPDLIKWKNISYCKGIKDNVKYAIKNPTIIYTIEYIKVGFFFLVEQ